MFGARRPDTPRNAPMACCCGWKAGSTASLRGPFPTPARSPPACPPRLLVVLGQSGSLLVVFGVPDAALPALPVAAPPVALPVVDGVPAVVPVAPDSRDLAPVAFSP